MGHDRHPSPDLWELRASWRNFVEHAPAALAVFDREMIYIAASARWRRDYGLSGDPAGRRHYDVFPDLPEAWKLAHRRCLNGASEKSDGEKFQRADGSAQWVRWEVTPWRDDEGEIGGLVIVTGTADMSERLEAEAELKRLNATLEERVREAVAAREAAYANLAQAEKLSALGQLAGGVAHDFNNIAQAITGAAALIGRNAGDPAKVRHFAEMMAQTASRAASITKRLLSLARRSDLKAEAFDVFGVLEGLREVLAHTLGPRIAMQLQAPKDLPQVLADRGQLETVVVNLASNARDAMEGDGDMVLSAASDDLPRGREEIGLRPGRYVRIAVADTGVGMDAATINRAMEPFFTTKGVGKGAGLGLPMARGFAQQSGGALTIESEPGRGATVKLWLPVGEPAVPTAQPAAVGGAKARRVLLVDDEDAVREVLRGELVDAGFDVVDAHGARPALAAMETARFDLLITDLSMPGLDGLGLIRAAQSRRPDLPAILLTGYCGEAAADAMRDFDERAVLLLGKPIAGPELADRISRFMQGRAQPAYTKSQRE